MLVTVSYNVFEKKNFFFFVGVRRHHCWVKGLKRKIDWLSAFHLFHRLVISFSPFPSICYQLFTFSIDWLSAFHLFHRLVISFSPFSIDWLSAFHLFHRLVISFSPFPSTGYQLFTFSIDWFRSHFLRLHGQYLPNIL